MSRIKYRLEGLDCADCAIKIQESLNNLAGVNQAEIIFATQKLNLDIDENINKVTLLDEIKKVILLIEPEAKIIEINRSSTPEKTMPSNLNKDNLFLCIGTVLFFIGIILKSSFWIEIVIFASSYLIVGKSVVIKSIYNIRKGQVFDENFLMTIATLGAFAIKEFPEAVAVMLFYRVGQLLESIAVNKSRSSIKSLMDIKAQYANLKTTEGIKQVDPNDVEIGEFIVIKPGERLPLDGIVVEGSSSVDTSAITGESVPRSVHVGDSVLSGFINTSSSLTVKVSTTFSNSTVAKILDLVENATSKKAPAENFITKFARYYTPAVVFVAAFIATVPTIISNNHDFSLWLYRALVFLVVSCPCALVISIPLSYFGGIGGASRRGILIKGSNYLDALNDVKTVVFDKTGTLTKGVFEVVEVFPENGYSKETLLESAALAEARSNHPIAKSILNAYGKNFNGINVDYYEEIPGCGIKAIIDKKEILAGNDRLLHLDGCIEHNTCNVKGTVVHVAVDNIYAGYILISDQIKADAAFTISQLKKVRGIRVAMLTGDSEESARTIAEKLKIEEYYYALLPHQKAEKLEQIKTSGNNSKLVFVGDGINDAPVLAMSDIGVAMGGLGSDAAIEASDIVLMTDEPSKLIEALKVAKKTRNIVIQNIVFALGVKVIIMILGAGGLATMWEAVFADVGVTVIAVFNSIRVMKK
jgi:Zn2+/Cd2+-exporting ATPase